jgi:hypothetical protein
VCVKIGSECYQAGSLKKFSVIANLHVKQSSRAPIRFALTFVFIASGSKREASSTWLRVFPIVKPCSTRYDNTIKEGGLFTDIYCP